MSFLPKSVILKRIKEWSTIICDDTKEITTPTLKYPEISDMIVLEEYLKIKDDIVSFVQRNDYIYGLYFNEKGEYKNYIECYYLIQNMIVINGLDIENKLTIFKCEDYQNILSRNGVEDNCTPCGKNKMRNVLSSIFTNQISYNDDNEIKNNVCFRVELSEKVKSKIYYPDGMKPMNIFVFYKNTLCVFVEKDNIIYGLYYDIIDKLKWDFDEIIKLRKPLFIKDISLESSKYIECYYEINNLILIHGLYYDDQPKCSIQYSSKHKFHQSWLYPDGINSYHHFVKPHYITGKSKNLLFDIQ